MDRETIAVYDAKFEDYANLFTSDKPSASLLRFINAVAPEGSVVDLGCGPGNSARAMAVSGLKVTAVDASAGMISLVEGTPNITAVQADFSWLDQTAAFDGIWANFSLLHAEREAFAGHLWAAYSVDLGPYAAGSLSLDHPTMGARFVRFVQWGVWTPLFRCSAIARERKASRYKVILITPSLAVPMLCCCAGHTTAATPTRACGRVPRPTPTRCATRRD